MWRKGPLFRQNVPFEGGPFSRGRFFARFGSRAGPCSVREGAFLPLKRDRSLPGARRGALWGSSRTNCPVNLPALLPLAARFHLVRPARGGKRVELRVRIPPRGNWPFLHGQAEAFSRHARAFGRLGDLEGRHACAFGRPGDPEGRENDASGGLVHGGAVRTRAGADQEAKNTSNHSCLGKRSFG